MNSLLEAGIVFLDRKAGNIDGIKPKYFIGLNSAEDEDDVVISCVFNTEHFPDRYSDGCNKKQQRFLLHKKHFDFQTNPTTIMLMPLQYYHVSDILDSRCKIVETCNPTLLRQIKNCLDKENVIQRYVHLLK